MDPYRTASEPEKTQKSADRARYLFAAVVVASSAYAYVGVTVADAPMNLERDRAVRAEEVKKAGDEGFRDGLLRGSYISNRTRQITAPAPLTVPILNGPEDLRNPMLIPCTRNGDPSQCWVESHSPPTP